MTLSRKRSYFLRLRVDLVALLARGVYARRVEKRQNHLLSHSMGYVDIFLEEFYNFL